MKMALSDIVSLCEAYIEYLANGSNGKLDVRHMSENTKESIQLVIEFAEKGDRNSLVFLLNSYQVLMARNRDFTYCKIDWPLAVAERDGEQETQKYNKMNTARRIIDWVSYKALVNIQFDYARTSNKIPDNDSMRSSFENDLSAVKRNEMCYLSNDEIFKKMFTEAVEDKTSGFFKPDYFSM
jgi:hypothetical protein